MRIPWARSAMVLGICALTACSRDRPTAPTAPALHTITGHLRLTGFLSDTSGAYTGTRVLGDPDGVPVELLHGTDVVARTTTMGGVYRFSGLRPGDYVARSRVIGNIGDETSPLVIAVTDVVAADTLRLVSRGTLLASPNPFVDTVQVSFLVTDPASIDVNVLDVACHPVKNLITLDVAPAWHIVFWNGRDQAGHPVAGSLYWVTYAAGDDVRALLLFREGLATPPRDGVARARYQPADVSARSRTAGNPRPPRVRSHLRASSPGDPESRLDRRH